MKPALFALLLLGASLVQLAQAAPVPPARADDFVDSIGVCTHWSYTDTPYGDFPRASALLGDLGVRHIRDGLHPHDRELFDKYGIKTTAIFGPGDTDIAAQLQSIKDSRSFLDMIEGPNEVDIFTNNASYKGQVFPEGARLYQNDLFAAVKGSPETAPLGVIAPSTAQAGSNAKLAPLSSLDYLVMHSYAGGNKPSDSLESDINNIKNAARLQGPNAVLKPIVVTESGYHNALNANKTLGGVQPGIDEATGAKYFPRHFALYFNAGIRRTFTYEFLNEFPNEDTNAEANFGLVHRDFTPKPAYTALKNLISLLGESKWNTATKTWAEPNPNFSPRALDFDLDGDTKDIRSTLLQKADGTYYLLLWREVQSFDTKTGKPIENPPAKVVLTVPAPSEVSALRITNNQPVTLTPIQSRIFRIGHRKLQFDVPDEVIALKITLGAQAQPDNTAPATPVNITSTTTGTAVNLLWAPSPDADVAGYFVSRLGQQLGRADGTTFTDEKLDPQQGYTYSIRAYDHAGNVSKPATIVAMTKDESPDLVITHVGLVVGEDALGQDAHFEATIENHGNGPTSAKVTHGVAFSIDSEMVAWSDTFQGPLAPGASVTVRSDNGPKGTATWHVTPGKHTIQAFVDDVNRINESNENNNVILASILK